MLEQVNSIAFWIVTTIFVWFFYGPWQNFWADWYRQEAFAARDRLFDLAASGSISFGDPSYRKQRREIDLSIRYAGATTWSHLGVLLIILKITGNFRRHVRNKDEDVADAEFRPVVLQLQKALVTMLVARAPLLWPVFILVAIQQFWQLAGRGSENVTNSWLLNRLLELGPSMTGTIIEI